MPPLLLELWREQHPKGHEQTAMDFQVRRAAINLYGFSQTLEQKN